MRTIRGVIAGLLLFYLAGGLAPVPCLPDASVSCCARSGGCSCGRRPAAGRCCTRQASCKGDSGPSEIPRIGLLALLPPAPGVLFCPDGAGDLVADVFLPRKISEDPPDPPPRRCR